MSYNSETGNCSGVDGFCNAECPAEYTGCKCFSPCLSFFNVDRVQAVCMCMGYVWENLLSTTMHIQPNSAKPNIRIKYSVYNSINILGVLQEKMNNVYEEELFFFWEHRLIKVSQYSNILYVHVISSSIVFIFLIAISYSLLQLFVERLPGKLLWRHIHLPTETAAPIWSATLKDSMRHIAVVRSITMTSLPVSVWGFLTRVIHVILKYVHPATKKVCNSQ